MHDMSNIQLLFSIGVPTLAVVVAMIRNENAIASLRSDLRGDISILSERSYQHGREIEALKK